MNEENKKEQRRSWRLRWIGMLFEFSHLEYQKGLWIERKYPNQVGWFGEDMCQYFDDLAVDSNYEGQLADGYISIDEFEIIKEFHLDLDKYESAGKSDSEILNDPEWINIVEKGNKAWNELKNVISEVEELNHMNGLVKKYLNRK
ncbi:MAG: hypothetical protein ACO1OQ_01205 [Rufibacter sp.]